MTSRYRFFGRLSFLFALVSLAGCSGKSEPVPDERPLECAEDLDKDGYGLGCPRGDDCNDTNAAIHTGCETCSSPNEGCECEPGSAPVTCIDKSLADEDTVLCKTGTRYCRDGQWSACESVAQFEVEVERKRSSVGGTSLALSGEGGVDGGTGDGGVGGDAGMVLDCTESDPPCCSICNPSCFNHEDPLTGPLPDGGNIVYADGGGITIDSRTVGDPIVVTPTTGCLLGTNPSDVDCDGIPDEYERATDTNTKPFGTTAGSIFMTLGPGESGTADIDLQFYLRTVDIYFLFDMTSGTVSNNGTASDPTDDFNVVQRMIASLTSNPKSPGQPFFSGTQTCADTDRDGVPNNTSGQGMLGDLSCLLRNVRIGVGWTREVPFEGRVGGIAYGADRIHPSAITLSDTIPDFSEFLFEQTSFLTSDMSSIAGSLGKLSLKENYGGPNGQMQGLWMTATGGEIYVGHDRPALPYQWRCASGHFGYPCFQQTAVPIVVLFTGSGLFNGPKTDIQGNAIANLGTDSDGDVYNIDYPAALHQGKVHRGSYPGYLPVWLEPPSGTSPGIGDTFTDPLWLGQQEHPGTGALVGDLGDDLLTFTGSTAGLNADVDATVLSCEGFDTAVGADAIFYFSLAQDEPNFTVSTEGTRFDSLLGIIKANSSGTPAEQNIDLTLIDGVTGDTSEDAYNLETLPSGVNYTLQGELSQAGNFPAEVLECYSAANTGQCGNENKASDYARDVVFKFNLEKDMRLWFQSVRDEWGSSMALFDGMPQGVTDINVINSVTGDPYETLYLPGGAGSTDPGPLNGHAYRLVGPTRADGCNSFSINDLDEDYLNSAVLYTSAPDTDPSTAAGQSHCKVSGFKDASSDMEVRFRITEDNTNVVFETSGDDPKLDSSDNVLLALRKIEVPDPNSHGVANHNNLNETWSSAYVIPEAHFTPVGTATEFAYVTGNMTAMAANIAPGELLTKVTSPAGVASECTLPTGGINGLQESVFKFTTTTTRSLKISALGVNGVKHYLSVHRRSKFLADPATTAPTYTKSSRDETVTTTYNHTAVATADTGFSLGNMGGAGFNISNNTTKSTVTSWDEPYIPCNTAGSLSKNQYYFFSVDKADGPITVTMTPNGWAGALNVMSGATLASLGCAAGTDTGARSVTFTPTAGQSYYVMMGGNATAGAGAYSLSITQDMAHDTIATAHDLGTIQNNAVSITSSTSKTGVNQNYDSPDMVFCNRSSGSAAVRNTYDQVYKFRVGDSNSTQIKVSLAYPGTAWKSNIQVYEANGANLGAVVPGTNSAGATATLGCDGGDNTNARSLSFAPKSNTDYYVIVSGYDNTSRGTYKLTVEDLQLGAVACTTTTAPERAIITLNNLPPDTYYVVLKIDDASHTYAGTYDVTVEDATVGPTNTIASTFVCELNNYLGYEDNYIGGNDPKRTKLEQTLDAGTYSLIMRTVGDSGGNTNLRVVMRDKSVMPDVIGCHNNFKGIDGEAKTYFDYDGEPLPACEDGYLASNQCKDSSGVSHYKDYYLIMRAVRQQDVVGADLPFEVKIRDLEPSSPQNLCTTTGAKGTFSGSLQAGDYFAVVKGVSATDEGWFQLTIGDKTTALADGDATTLRTYSGTGGVLEALTSQGIRVISVQDGTNTTTFKQLQTLSKDTGALAINSAPLVVQLSDTGVDNKTVFSLSDVGYGVTQAIQQLSQSLIMDVTLALDASMPNPGFTFDFRATGTPATTNCATPNGAVWEDCGTGATPDFRVTIGNPANAPVGFADEDGDGVKPPTDTDDPGGYNMLLNLVGKVEISPGVYRSYIVEQIPVRIVPTTDSYAGPVPMYSEMGVYSQVLDASTCLTAEAPDWSRLDWEATIPGYASFSGNPYIEWGICTGNTEAEAAACSPNLVATVELGDACSDNSQCPQGFCNTSQGICWNVLGTTCSSDASCGEGGRCVRVGTADYCSWGALPIDVGPTLYKVGQNGKKFARVETKLYASENLRSAPTIHSWSLEYDCVSGE